LRDTLIWVKAEHCEETRVSETRADEFLYYAEPRRQNSVELQRILLTRRGGFDATPVIWAETRNSREQIGTRRDVATMRGLVTHGTNPLDSVPTALTPLEGGVVPAHAPEAGGGRGARKAGDGRGWTLLLGASLLFVEALRGGASSSYLLLSRLELSDTVVYEPSIRVCRGPARRCVQALHTCPYSSTSLLLHLPTSDQLLTTHRSPLTGNRNLITGTLAHKP